MKFKVYSVRDERVEAFLPPFNARAKGEAIRSFMEAVGNKEHPFAKHPADYVLYELGEFDDVSGRHSSVEPTRIMSGFEAREDADSHPLSS